MEKERLLALSCCGESVEKVLTLYYHASKLSSPAFYGEYRPVLFYGHNLPKRDGESCAHGTVGFYQKFLLDIEYLPCTEMRFLWTHREAVLKKLIYEGYLTGRSAERLAADLERYKAFVKNLPFEVIYPQYMKALVDRAVEELDIFKLQPLYLEQNKDTNECVHLCTEMGKKSILSGNSALLLYQIGLRIGPQTVVGYRKRRSDKRPNREYALNMLISGRKTVLEPKNTAFTQYYLGLDEKLTDEQRGNIAFAKGYTAFLQELVQGWRLDPMKDEYIMEG